MGLNWAEHSEDIDAPIETCFDAIADYESFPSWQDAVDSVEVIDRTKDGLGRNVHLYVDAKVRKIDYVLAYSYDRPTKITWDFVEGNGMRAMDGTYSFEELGPDRTRATYNLGADPAIPVPGIVMRRTHKQLVKRSVEDLKREAERRAMASEGAKASSPKGLAGFGRRRPPEEPTVERPAEPAPSGSSPADLIPRDVGSAVKLGRDVTEGAVRAGFGVARSAAKAGLGVATSAMDRVARALGNDAERD
jgi:uncharacterized membrane protein